MVTFVHLTDSKKESSIRRNGISSSRRRFGDRRVYAVPVIPNFSTTHQWARELRRWGARTLICVQFQLPDDERVLVGPYYGEKEVMTAARAAGTFFNHTDPTGFEVIISRTIGPKEITRVYLAPRITGWRFAAGAKGRKPCRCGTCAWLGLGQIRARKIYGTETGR